jgi:Mn2+/Fe2+ NRAMP family transporter
MIGTGLLAIPVLTASAAYAVKEFFGFRGSLSESPRARPTFYGLIVVALLGGLLMSILNIDPIQALVVTAIINGVVAPPILVLLALLARDRRVMGEHRSGALSNALVWIATGAHGRCRGAAGRDPRLTDMRRVAAYATPQAGRE